MRRALLLIDARHGVKEVDERVMAMLDKAAVSYQVVLTKIDQLKPAELAHRLSVTAQVCAGHTAAHPEVQATSAEKGQGIAELRAALAALVDWQSELRRLATVA